MVRVPLNILFLADPNLIHDVRWIRMIEVQGNNCFVIPRRRHYDYFLKSRQELPANIRLLRPIRDPSTTRPLRDFLQAIRIWREIRKNRIDVFHVIYAEPNALWAGWKRFFCVPMILTTLGTDILITIPSFFKRRDLLGRFVAWRYLRAMNRFDAITCTSNSQIKALTRLKIRVPAVLIRTGVDFELVSNSNLNICEKLGLRKPVILMPRNMKPIYNHEFTLEAIQLLDLDLLGKYCFVFVNADTEQQGYFERVLRHAQKIKADIRFFSSFSHSEILSLCKEASLVIMNPTSDGSPVSAMEALACGTPVVLPPLDYDEEIFSHAFVFQQWHPEALRDKIEEALRIDRGSLTKHLAAGVATVKSKGNADREIGKLVRIYAKIISNGN